MNLSMMDKENVWKYLLKIADTKLKNCRCSKHKHFTGKCADCRTLESRYMDERFLLRKMRREDGLF